MISATPSLTNFDAANWTLLEEKNGISLYSWEVPGAGIPAYKSETNLDFPMEKIATVIGEIGRRTDWTPDLNTSEIIRKISDTEWIERWTMSAPMVDDREFVFHTQMTRDPKTKAILIRFHSVEEFLISEKYVRGWIYGGYYRLNEIEGGKSTHIEHAVHVSIKGAVPNWLVTSTLRPNTRKTLEGLKRQLKK